jgi:hypothetical protein
MSPKNYKNEQTATTTPTNGNYNAIANSNSNNNTARSHMCSLKDTSVVSTCECDCDGITSYDSNDAQSRSESNAEWEERVAEIEREERKEVRSHVERLLSYNPECAMLALQCEHSRMQAQAHSLDIRRRLRSMTEDEAIRREAHLKRLVRILSFTVVAMTAGIIFSNVMSCSSRKEEKCRTKSQPDTAAAAPSPVSRAPVPLTVPPTPPPPPASAAAPSSVIEQQQVASLRHENYKYVIVRQKLGSCDQ